MTWCGALQITRFHVIVFFAWQLAIYFACQQLFPIFSNYSPRFRCSSGNDSTTAFGKDCAALAKCPPHDVEFEQVAFYSTVLEFNMFCGERAYFASLISSLQFFGVIVGTISYGHMADKFGRKPISLLSISLGILFVMVSGASPSWLILLIFRFLVGTSVGGVVVVYTYVVELILPQQRMFLRAFFNWGIGRVTLTVVCALVPYWRTASVVSAAVVLPFLPIVYFVFPESPTWLENKGRFREMHESQTKIARIAGIASPTFTQKHDLSRECEKPEKLYSIRDLFANPTITKRTLILCLLWFTASLCSYANDLNSRTLAGDFYLNQILFSIVIVSSKVAMFGLDTLVPQFSRRKLHQIPQACVVVCFTALMCILIFEDAPVAVLVISIVGAVLIEYTWDACYLSSAEGFPTEVRAIGVSSCSLVARVGALLAPQLAFLGTLWRPSPFLAVALLGFVTLIFSCLYLPETKGADLAVRDRAISFLEDEEQKKQEEEHML
uniref:Major facilitator superfamily (MFS) profile domain-containing protein n=1 Tax=Plectus sambesii TaxID=2011161 RepID=A0A914UL20_9BILA